jgi:hypothetical protein
MLAQLILDSTTDDPVWALFDEGTLLRYYDGGLSSAELYEKIVEDWGDVAVTVMGK